MDLHQYHLHLGSEFEMYENIQMQQREQEGYNRQRPHKWGRRSDQDSSEGCMGEVFGRLEA